MLMEKFECHIFKKDWFDTECALDIITIAGGGILGEGDRDNNGKIPFIIFQNTMN